MELQWPLILFTTLLAWSAGLFATQSLYSIKGKGAHAQMKALIVSFVVMVVSGICVFFHLEHWDRIFNGFGHITSGITQELIAIVVLFLCMVVYFVYLRRSGDEAKVPKWLAVASIIVAIALMIVAGHSYMMASRPSWNSVFQIASLLGAAAAMGAATMALLCATAKGSESLDGTDEKSVAGDTAELDGKVNKIGQLLNAVLTIIYIAAMALAGSSFTSVDSWFDPTSPTQDITSTASASPFAGSALIATIAAIVLALIGVVCALRGKKTGNWKVWGAAGLVCALLSAGALRILFYMMGVSVYPFF